ncbi:MAG: hypothetical protein WCJ33_04575 [Pseudomonadota bacterium]
MEENAVVASSSVVASNFSLTILNISKNNKSKLNEFAHTWINSMVKEDTIENNVTVLTEKLRRENAKWDEIKKVIVRTMDIFLIGLISDPNMDGISEITYDDKTLLQNLVMQTINLARDPQRLLLREGENIMDIIATEDNDKKISQSIAKKVSYQIGVMAYKYTTAYAAKEANKLINVGQFLEEIDIIPGDIMDLSETEEFFDFTDDYICQKYGVSNSNYKNTHAALMRYVKQFGDSEVDSVVTSSTAKPGRKKSVRVNDVFPPANIFTEEKLIELRSTFGIVTNGKLCTSCFIQESSIIGCIQGRSELISLIEEEEDPYVFVLQNGSVQILINVNISLYSVTSTETHANITIRSNGLIQTKFIIPSNQSLVFHESIFKKKSTLIKSANLKKNELMRQKEDRGSRHKNQADTFIPEDFRPQRSKSTGKGSKKAAGDDRQQETTAAIICYGATSTRTRRTIPNYKCSGYMVTDQYGTRECPNICPSFGLFNNKLYCTECARLANYVNEAKFVTKEEWMGMHMDINNEKSDDEGSNTAEEEMSEDGKSAECDDGRGTTTAGYCALLSVIVFFTNIIKLSQTFAFLCR